MRGSVWHDRRLVAGDDFGAGIARELEQADIILLLVSADFLAALADGGLNFDEDVKTIAHYGLFLKSSTSVVGPAAGIHMRFPDRRTDHEIELVVVIGRGGRDIKEQDALSHVAGYAIGLDMTLRGTEDRSLRKSLDGFSVLGPWLTTSDEVPDSNDLNMTLAVNGQVRQKASTRDLIFNVQHLIAYASSFYTLCRECWNKLASHEFTSQRHRAARARALDREHLTAWGHPATFRRWSYRGPFRPSPIGHPACARYRGTPPWPQ